MELMATYGVIEHEEPCATAPCLLRVFASASAVQRPHDWFGVQKASNNTGLEITLRDPFMVGAMPGEGVLGPPFPLETSPGNQCPLGQAWQDGDACVIAVVKLNGTLLGSNHTIHTYVANKGGAAQKVGEVEARGGVTVVSLPRTAKDQTYYARVVHKHKQWGIYKGTAYEETLYEATTSTVLSRPAVAPTPAVAPPPAWPVAPPPPSPPPPTEVFTFSQNFGESFGASLLSLFVFCLIIGVLAICVQAGKGGACGEIFGAIRERRRPTFGNESFLPSGQ